jgi:hypothetical protein
VNRKLAVDGGNDAETTEVKGWELSANSRDSHDKLRNGTDRIRGSMAFLAAPRSSLNYFDSEMCICSMERSKPIMALPNLDANRKKGRSILILHTRSALISKRRVYRGGCCLPLWPD